MDAIIFTTATGFDVAMFGPHSVEENTQRQDDSGVLVTSYPYGAESARMAYVTKHPFDCYTALAQAKDTYWIDLREHISLVVGAEGGRCPPGQAQAAFTSLTFSAETGNRFVIRGPLTVEQGHTVDITRNGNGGNGVVTTEGVDGLFLYAACLATGSGPRRYVRVPDITFSEFMVIARSSNGGDIDLYPHQTAAKAQAGLREWAANRPAP